MSRKGKKIDITSVFDTTEELPTQSMEKVDREPYGRGGDRRENRREREEEQGPSRADEDTQWRSGGSRNTSSYNSGRDSGYGRSSGGFGGDRNRGGDSFGRRGDDFGRRDSGRDSDRFGGSRDGGFSRGGDRGGDRFGSSRDGPSRRYEAPVNERFGAPRRPIINPPRKTVTPVSEDKPVAETSNTPAAEAGPTDWEAKRAAIKAKKEAMMGGRSFASESSDVPAVTDSNDRFGAFRNRREESGSRVTGSHWQTSSRRGDDFDRRDRGGDDFDRRDRGGDDSGRYSNFGGRDRMDRDRDDSNRGFGGERRFGDSRRDGGRYDDRNTSSSSSSRFERPSDMSSSTEAPTRPSAGPVRLRHGAGSIAAPRGTIVGAGRRNIVGKSTEKAADAPLVDPSLPKEDQIMFLSTVTKDTIAQFLKNDDVVHAVNTFKQLEYPESKVTAVRQFLYKYFDVTAADQKALLKVLGAACEGSKPSFDVETLTQGINAIANRLEDIRFDSPGAISDMRFILEFLCKKHEYLPVENLNEKALEVSGLKVAEETSTESIEDLSAKAIEIIAGDIKGEELVKVLPDGMTGPVLLEAVLKSLESASEEELAAISVFDDEEFGSALEHLFEDAEKDVALAGLNACVKFVHTKGLPKIPKDGDKVALIEIIFHSLYENDIIAEEMFVEWTEDYECEVKGWQKAVIQTTMWMQWLKQQMEGSSEEEEEESEDDLDY
eukprot:TRINITY_DN1626_c0_g1_i1.p1 TRINITY_DN1626_c0_g1~~TRINITY_DN1626_c0_g1_i1.p1  ORF type:complete len:718 (+),score=316.15 TRINITY_DN1626_c0_g1_i1:146-2299(+)